LGLVCLDQSAPISAYIALEKARTAALGRRESKAYEDMVNNGRTAFLSAPQLTSLAGGIPIIVDGQVIAAIGVSGVKPEEDISVAQAGSAALSPAKDLRIHSTSRSLRDLRSSPDRSMTKPNAISKRLVRFQASKVRSAAKKTRGSSRCDIK